MSAPEDAVIARKRIERKVLVMEKSQCSESADEGVPSFGVSLCQAWYEVNKTE